MAAYASLLALAQTLHQILTLDRYTNPLDKEKIVSLLQKVDFSANFLEDYSEKHGVTVDRVGNEMRNATYEAQDFMDSYLYLVSRNDFDSSSSDACSEVSVDQDLDLALERITFFWEETMKIKNSDTTEDLEPITNSSPVDNSSAIEIPARNMVVGFDDDINAINEQLYEDSTKLQIIPIVGMGGIGKTTLARRAYDDSLLCHHFDICAWITVSAEYQRGQILSGLLRHLKKLDKEQSDQSDAQLATLAYQNLTGRRYLIVIDDIWSTEAWDDVKMIFPDDDNGSRILLTTRLFDVAVYAGSSSTSFHQMNFLNEDQSWKLLQKRIFAQESCPLELVEIGKKIARNCSGLPLTIVVVAGLLLSSNNMMKEELWQNVAETISSEEPTIALQCSKILCLSYDWLPLRLKPCFLYMAAFPEDSEIDVSKLIMLWVAEGFLKPGDRCECLEDVGEGYLKDLVNRNLILVGEKGPDGKLITVKIHDLLWEICITKSEEEGFLHHASNAGKEVVVHPKRRLSYHCAQILQELQTLDSSVRSIFCKIHFISELSLSCRRLRIFDAPGVTWINFSNEISTFINLRYIAFTLNNMSFPDGFPASISRLPHLETIIADGIYQGLLQLPYEILRMPKLRHLITSQTCYISNLSYVGIIDESDLQTLDSVINCIFTEEIIKILVNLKKLSLVIAKLWNDNWDEFKLNNLFRLQNLEELQVLHRVDNYLYMRNIPNPSLIWNYAFPIHLKKLILRGVPFPWKNMTIIGSLPNLQVFEIVENGMNGFPESWTTVEGEFLQLKHFCSSLEYLSKWEMEKEHFPSLESLILKNVWWINEIPCGIEEIDSLQLIELQYCHESLVNSAKRIQDQQLANGNYDFQVRVIGNNHV